MKNKKKLIILGVVLLLFLVGGIYIRSKTEVKNEPVKSYEDEIIKLSPKDIGLEFISNAAKNQVKFILNKPEGIESVAYEISYEADAPKGYEGEDRISRGIAGDEKISPQQSKFESKFFDLGSCSSGTCRFDSGVKEVNLLLKINKNDNKVYQVEDKLSLE